MNLQSVVKGLEAVGGTGETIAVVDPATEDHIVDFGTAVAARSTRQSIRARSSFEHGVCADLPARDRAKVLWKVGDLIDERSAELASLDSVNIGQSRLATEGILPACAEMFRYYAGWCTKIEGASFDVRMTAGISGRQPNFTATPSKNRLGLSA